MGAVAGIGTMGAVEIGTIRHKHGRRHHAHHLYTDRHAATQGALCVLCAVLLVLPSASARHGEDQCRDEILRGAICKVNGESCSCG